MKSVAVRQGDIAQHKVLLAEFVEMVYPAWHCTDMAVVKGRVIIIAFIIPFSLFSKAAAEGVKSLVISGGRHEDQGYQYVKRKP